MHEMSLMQGILERATEALSGYQVAKVNSLHVKIGVLANIMPEAFDFAFEVLTQDSIFAGAQLMTDILPLQARCSQCGRVFEQEQISLICPYCQLPTGKVISGGEVYLASIDFEEAESKCN